MKLCLLACFFCLTVSASGCTKVLVRPSVDMARYNRLAVMPFDTHATFLSGNQLADEIIILLLQKAPNLDIVERARVDTLVREQNLQRQGALSPESGVAVGRMMGAHAILMGSVTIGPALEEVTPLGARRSVTGAATARLLDTETGQIVWAGRETAEAVLLILDADAPVIIKTDADLAQEVIGNLARKLAMHFYPHFELH